MPLTTHHDTMTVQELMDHYRHGRLNLSPAFQRQSVWSAGARRLLIKSLFDGVPLPTIYLYKQIGHGGKPVYDVIDGKQRIETILLFRGKGPLVQTEKDLWIRHTFDDDEPLDWWDWSWLAAKDRNTFLTSKLPTIEVEGEFTEIVDLFVRINSTGKSLTSQEKRNARYFESPLLKEAQRQAQKLRNRYRKHRILSESQLQRMKHIELTTEFLIAIAQKGHPNKKAQLDKVISGESATIADIKSAGHRLNRAVTLTLSTLPDIQTTRFSNIADFYTLVMLVHSLDDQGYAVSTRNIGKHKLAGGLLREFGQEVDLVTEQLRHGRNISSRQSLARDYLMTTRGDTDSSKQRRAREKILEVVLDGVFEPKDAQRVFNKVQRRILWNASTKKRCAICGDGIRSWDDLHIDHIYPFALGGRTQLSNAALTHKKCNMEKGTGVR